MNNFNHQSNIDLKWYGYIINFKDYVSDVHGLYSITAGEMVRSGNSLGFVISIYNKNKKKILIFMNRKPESYFKKIYVIEGFKKYKKFKHKTFLKLLFILFLIFFTILRITNTAQAEDYNTRISVFVKSSTGLSLEELKKNECSSIKFSPKYFYIFGAVPSKILQLKLVQQTTLSGYLKEKNPWVFDVFFRKKHQKPEGEIVDILVYYDEEEEKINSPPKSLEISNVEDTLDSGMDNPLSNSNESYSFIGDSLMNFFHSFQEGFFFIIDFLSSFF